MKKSWAHSYVYSYDSEMNRIKTSSDKKQGIVVIDLGSDYAGKNFTIYSGRKSTEKKIISGTLDKNGRYKFSSSVGRNYTLVLDSVKGKTLRKTAELKIFFRKLRF